MLGLPLVAFSDFSLVNLSILKKFCGVVKFWLKCTKVFTRLVYLSKFAWKCLQGCMSILLFCQILSGNVRKFSQGLVYFCLTMYLSNFAWKCLVYLLSFEHELQPCVLVKSWKCSQGLCTCQILKILKMFTRLVKSWKCSQGYII